MSTRTYVMPSVVLGAGDGGRAPVAQKLVPIPGGRRAVSDLRRPCPTTRYFSDATCGTHFVNSRDDPR
jgi:hypothetical protein